MSHHYIHATDLPAGGEQLKTDKIAKVKNLCLLVGLVGLVISLILLAGNFGHPERNSLAHRYAFSWLFGFEVCFTITVGTLFWVLLHNASNSGWGVTIRRIPETFSNNLLIVGILGAPLVLIPEIRETVWTWIGFHAEIEKGAAPAGVQGLRDVLHAGGHKTHLLYHKYPLLNVWSYGALPGFVPRYFIYFAALAWVAWQMKRYSISQDATGNVRTTFSARRFACGTLPIFALCATFACVDWVKSLNYTWFSTMWGVNVFAACALSSMATLIIIVGFLKKTGHLDHIVSQEHFHIMGKLMHAFIIFWAYIAFSQYFLIWYANIPEETQFFAIRNTGGWNVLSISLTLGHFVLPFILLLRRDSKKNLNVAMVISALILVVHILECYWWILPQRGPVVYDYSNAPTFGGAIADFVLDMLALVTFIGISGYFFFRRLGTASIYPCGDPRLEESVNLKN
jgi:hypothetical protein